MGQEFSVEAKITRLEQHGDHWHYYVTHPTIEHFAAGTVRAPSKKDRQPSKSKICGAIFDEYAAVLVSDIRTAKSMRTPLGAAAMIHERILSKANEEPTVQNALFSLELPVLSGLPVKELIKIRQLNWQYFDAFRLALRNAAKDYLANVSDGAPSTTIAAQIQEDLIEPELIRIRRELRIASDALSRKSVLSLPLGSLATTIGLLDKIPLSSSRGRCRCCCSRYWKFPYRLQKVCRRQTQRPTVRYVFSLERATHR